jgi:hypothetical protein
MLLFDLLFALMCEVSLQSSTTYIVKLHAIHTALISTLVEDETLDSCQVITINNETLLRCIPAHRGILIP